MLRSCYRPFFRPSLISDISGWWDAKDIKTITQADGYLSQWNDKSGLGRNFTQITDVSQPEYETTGWDGKPSILFNGADGYMIADAVAADFTGDDKPCTVIMAVEMVSHTSSATHWCFGHSGNIANYYWAFEDATGNVDIYRRDQGTGSPVQATGSTVLSGRRIHSTVFPGTEVSTYIDSVVDINGAALDLNSVTLDRFTLGARRRNAGSSDYAHMRIAEMIIYKRALLATERQAVESYLITKWDVT
jgi:hypothetical protein